MEFDVVIVGAGITGLAMAASLLQSGLRVCAMDKVLPTGELTPQVDARVFAITPASADFLKAIGAWDLLSHPRLSPYRAMSVWDSAGEGAISFDSRSVYRDHLGHIIENQVLIAALWQRCMALSLHVEAGTPRSWKEQGDKIAITTEAGTVLNAALLVGADGAESWVRQYAMIPTNKTPYGHDAIVATIRTEHPHQRSARQCFLQQGPLALLPLKDLQLCSIVWSTEPAHANSLMAMDADAFAGCIESIYQDKVGQVVLESQRHRFPLIARHAAVYAKGRAVLVGDAAHTIHPLAGQGANLGFYDVKCLSDLISQAALAGRDIGSRALLGRYQRARRSHNSVMQGMMTAFKQGFESENRVLTGLRNWGLRYVNNQEWLKKQLIQGAMGY